MKTIGVPVARAVLTFGLGATLLVFAAVRSNADWGIEHTAWIGCANDDGHSPAVFRFSCDFMADGNETEVAVSADERFVLFLDDHEIMRGPDRGYPSRWKYQRGKICPHVGPHRLWAVVWRFGDKAPVAQLSYRGGSFVLKANGKWDARLTTGVAPWMCGKVEGLALGVESDRGETYGAGWPVVEKGCSPFDEIPRTMKPAVIVRKATEPNECGISAPGWQLVASSLPEQRHLTRQILAERIPCVVPAQTNVTLTVDLKNYFCAYPELVTTGGAGSEVRWSWMERISKNRFTDTFLPDGRCNARFTTPWWRSGRMCEIMVRTGKEPLILERAALVETGYPIENSSIFECDDQSIHAVRRICLRALEMCSHEMSMDCPFYEQQMYPGDSRVQFLALTTVTSDPRLVLSNLDAFDHDRRSSGFIAMNTPTRGTQDSATYTLCYPVMLADALRWRECGSWLRKKIPGLRQTMSVFSNYEKDNGLLGELPGWNFADWVPEWRIGVAPSGDDGISAFVSLYYVLALRSAAEVERAVGDEAVASIWTAKAERVALACRQSFWDKCRGMMADNAKKNTFSEHVQCLALLSNALDDNDAGRAFSGLVLAEDLARTTVYF